MCTLHCTRAILFTIQRRYRFGLVRYCHFIPLHCNKPQRLSFIMLTSFSRIECKMCPWPKVNDCMDFFFFCFFVFYKSLYPRTFPHTGHPLISAETVYVHLDHSLPPEFLPSITLHCSDEYNSSTEIAALRLYVLDRSTEGTDFIREIPPITPEILAASASGTATPQLTATPHP